MSRFQNYEHKRVIFVHNVSGRLKPAEILAKHLGDVEAERFIAIIQREPFDYTKWRMKNERSLVLFEKHKIRRDYDEKTETWYFSVVDIIAALIQQPDYQAARKHWNNLKERLKKEEGDRGPLEKAVAVFRPLKSS